jgi:hypothetical protein
VAEPVPGVRPLFRGLPRVVIALGVLFAITMTVWTIVLPPYRSADESEHVSAALYLNENAEWPGFKQMHMLGAVVRTAGDTSHYPSLTVADAPTGAEPPFSVLDMATTGQIDRSGQHPPGYYGVLAGVISVLPTNIPWNLELWILRLVSVILLAPLPIIAAATARLWGATRPVMIAAAVAVFAVPQLAVLGGAVNNDNLLDAAGAWLILGISVVLRGDLRLRTALWIGAVCAVALFTKAWALPIVFVVGLAYLIAGYRSRRWRSTATALGLTVGVAALGGWWWVANLLRYGSIQPAGHSPALQSGPLGALETAVPLVRGLFSRFPTRFWAALSVKDGELPFPIWVPLIPTAILLGLLVIALVRKTTFDLRRLDALVLVLPSALCYVVLVLEVWGIYRKTGLLTGIQGRYVYVGVIGLLVVATLVAGALLRPAMQRWLPLALGVLALGATIVSVARAASYHWGDERWASIPGAMEAMIAWSPLPGGVVVGILVLFVLGIAGVVALLVRETVRSATSEQQLS